MALAFVASAPTRAAAQAVAALSGTVTSAAEGAMEGVVVTARADGAHISVSVVSDAEGRYRFPAGRLAPAAYTLNVRAVGYDLEAPATLTLAASTGTTRDLRLRKTTDLAPQLTNAEWMMSLPGTTEQKLFLDRCTGCHSLERIVSSRHTADDFLDIFARMRRYAPGTRPGQTQLLPDLPAQTPAERERLRPRAEYLAQINLSRNPTRAYPLRTLPRPRSRETHVIVTEYDLPRAGAMPHDVIVDRDGMVWYSDFSRQIIGRLDPRSGAVRDYPLPHPRPDRPSGSLDLEFDQDGNIWIGMMLQAAIARFDRSSGATTLLPLPRVLHAQAGQQAMVAPEHAQVDGKVWANAAGLPGVVRFDLASGGLEIFEPYKGMPAPRAHSVYGIRSDSRNNLYFFDFGADYVGRIDAGSGKITLLQTLTPRSAPRRGFMDAQDRLWFTQYRANRLAMLDTRSERFTEWPLTTPYAMPYDVMPDAHGTLWAGGMANDRLTRLDPTTGKEINYLLPHGTNIRRVFVDPRQTSTTVWVGSNLGGAIVRLETPD